jgi:PAS domain S-box-containing protein
MAPGASAAAKWPWRDSEMAQAVREHDWAATPLGPIEQWSDRLRLSVEQMLALPQASSLVVGPEMTLIYNDAAAGLYGDRHPEALGRPMRATFADVGSDASSLYDDAFAGHTVPIPADPSAAGQVGGPMEGPVGNAVFPGHLIPLRDAAGAVMAVQAIGSEANRRWHETEVDFRDLVGAMYRGFCVVERLPTDPVDFRYVSANAAFSRHTGLGDPVGRTIRQLVPTVEPFIMETYDRVARTRMPEAFQTYVAGLDLWVDVDVFPVAQTGRIAIVFDSLAERSAEAVERARAEAALRELSAQLRSFGEATSDVLWIRQAATLDWTYLSPAFESMFGLSREVALRDGAQRDWLETVIPEDRERVRACLDRVRAGEQMRFEYRIRRASDGAIRTLRNSDFPIRDASGQVDRIGGVTQDATQQHLARGALVASERRLRTLIEGIPQLVWRAARDGQWTWASPQWTDRTGQSTEESRGWGWLRALHPDDRDAVLEAWDLAESTGMFQIDHRVHEADGSGDRWYQARATPVRDAEGRIVEWLGTSTDVQEMRRLQEHLRALVADLETQAGSLVGAVRKLGDRTRRSEGEHQDLAPLFRDRMQALLRPDGPVSRLFEGERVAFDELLRAVLGMVSEAASWPGKVVLRGTRAAVLPPATAKVLALGLHELASNAARHGALAQSEGQLAVRWVLIEEQEQRLLHMEWRETRVTLPASGAGRRGAGLRFIEQVLPEQIGAYIALEVTPDGVQCAITVPIERRAAS